MERLTVRKQSSWLWWRIVGVATAAAILYYSWPLGYWLNPAAGKNGLASDLQATGQPYNWLFVLFDVASGTLIILVTLWLVRIWRRNMKLSIKFILWGYGLFGALTALDALIPMNCLVDEQRCGAVIHNPTILLHGLASIGSIGGLTLSIVGMWQLLAITRQTAPFLRWLLHAIVLIWLGFGLLTLTLVINGWSSGLAQHVFISICSAWIALLPYLLIRLYTQELEMVQVLEIKTIKQT